MLDINFNSKSDHCLPHLKLQHVAATGYPHPLLPEARAAQPTELQLASGPRLAFDRVFPQSATPRKGFRYIAHPLVQPVMEGANTRVFAYGNPARTRPP